MGLSCLHQIRNGPLTAQASSLRPGVNVFDAGVVRQGQRPKPGFVGESQCHRVHVRLQGDGSVGISDVFEFAFAEVLESAAEGTADLALNLFAAHVFRVDALLYH